MSYALKLKLVRQKQSYLSFLIHSAIGFEDSVHNVIQDCLTHKGKCRNVSKRYFMIGSKEDENVTTAEVRQHFLE